MKTPELGTGDLGLGTGSTMNFYPPQADKNSTIYQPLATSH